MTTNPAVELAVQLPDEGAEPPKLFQVFPAVSAAGTRVANEAGTRVPEVGTQLLELGTRRVLVTDPASSQFQHASRHFEPS